jgi:predicted dehydrogenase
MYKYLILALLGFHNISAQNISKKKANNQKTDLKIVTLDPGHFHAALVQKTDLKGVSPEVYVYAPKGAELEQHLARINAYNSRAENPTHWHENVYEGPDYFEKMISEKKGDVVVMSGNNAKKTASILATVKAGMNVLADKPMCIDAKGYEQLKEAFKVAKQNNVLLYDIMTERSEITTVLQKELSQIPEIFGKLQIGTLEKPAIVKESVHHFYKFVSGAPLIRPSWFMDTKQQGEGIVDVTTHLVDLVQWAAFPETALQIQDAKLLKAKRWATNMTLDQFSTITDEKAFPAYMKNNLSDPNTLQIFANGEIDYTLKGHHAKVRVIWNYSTDKGGDTHYSIMRGTKSEIEITQTDALPQLSINSRNLSEAEVKKAIETLSKTYEGLGYTKTESGFLINIPAKFRTGHESHFGEVMERFLHYYDANKLPAWEVPNMLLKYYITTQALELAKK